MKELDRHYPRPLVPEHLTKLTIEKLPLSEVFFISPGERDDYQAPAIFVTAERELVMAKSYAIDADDAYPSNPLGLIGVMRIPIIDERSNSIRDAFVADLRFIDNHQLVDAEDTALENVDQEQFMAWVSSIEDSVVFEGFIAPEPDEDMDRDIPKGIFYGATELHPFLKQLRKRSNRVMKKYIKRQSRPATPTLAVDTGQAVPITIPNEDKPKGKKVDLGVRFSG